MRANKKGRSYQPHRTTPIFGLIAILALGSGLADAESKPGFPDAPPVSLQAAVDRLAGNGDLPVPCLTSKIQRLGSRASLTRAIGQISEIAFPVERRMRTPDGTQFRFNGDPATVDDLVQAVWRGLDEARLLLNGRLELSRPENIEVVFAELGDETQGYLVRGFGRNSGLRMVLDVTPTMGIDSIRRAAIHQFAHAVALEAHPGFPVDWAEGFATWSTMVLAPDADPATDTLIGLRLADLTSGLIHVNPDLAGGNAAWFEFLAESFGVGAVKQAFDELAGGSPIAVALDRAVRGASGGDLQAAFREFHLWAMLTGPHADREHFSFAKRIAQPGFASSSEGLPALSIQADRAVAAMGATQVLLRPDSEGNGGLKVRFEGDFSIPWDLDLILLGKDGSTRRLRLEVEDGRAVNTVPIEGLDSAWLLIRNLDAEHGVPRRYSYTAHLEKGYPFDLAYLEASPQEENGILISWETASESDLVGFNILRIREDGSPAVAVNPVWIPALGKPDRSTTYHFVDLSCKGETTYAYRIQGVTRDGMVSVSESVVARRP